MQFIPYAERGGSDGFMTFCEFVNIDAFVRSPFCPVFVILAHAGIQEFSAFTDSRFSTLHSNAIAEDGRGSDGFMTFCEFVNIDH